jgi:transcription initiation factor TFIID TATA-box-binding protein
MPQIKVQNVVAAFAFKTELDLERIHRLFAKECFFETLSDRRFNFRLVALRIKEPSMSFLIYKTGKVVCTGAKTIKDAEQSAGYLLYRLRKAGLNIQLKTNAKVENIVATTDLNTSIDLEKFMNKTRKERQFYVIYEPEQFPAAIVKFPVVQGSEATVLLFHSGRLICVGLATYSHIQKAIELLISKLRIN